MRVVRSHIGHTDDAPLSCGSGGPLSDAAVAEELPRGYIDSASARPLSASRNTRGDDPVSEHPCLSMAPPRARMSGLALPHRNGLD